MDIKEFEIVKENVNAPENEFDSHAFIREFIKRYPQSYGALLIKHKNVNTANAEIANFLRRNDGDLHIIKAEEDVISKDILGYDVPNALWRKI